jgi:uncharacterized repeat protein (TIGR03803 family)
MQTKKLLSVVALLCAMLCSTFTQAQERILGYANPYMFSVNKDGTDLQLTSAFNSPVYGESIEGILPLPNGEIFLSTRDNFGEGRLSKITATGLDTLYRLTYAQTIGNFGMTLGNDGNVYVPAQGVVTIKLSGVYVANPDGSSMVLEQLYTQPFSADYYLTTTSEGIFGISRGNINYKGGIFKLNFSNSNGYDFIYNFTGGVDGSAPTGELTLGQDGYLFGRTLKGGIDNKGIYFKIKQDGTSFTKLFDVATGNIGTLDPSGKFQRLLDLIGVGYLPQRDSEGVIFLNTEHGIYKVGEDGYPILQVTNFGGTRIHFVTPSFDHVVTVNNIADGATNQPLSLTVNVNAFTGANRYDLQVSTTADFSVIAQELSNTSPTFELYGLDPDTHYYVRARPDIYPYYGEPTHFSTTSSPLVVSNRIWTYSGSATGSSILGDELHTFESTAFSEDNNVLAGLPLANGEKILITDGNDVGIGEIWKVTAQGVVKLYDILDYPDYAYIRETMVDGEDGYVYALNFGVASPFFSGFIRFKTDGTSYEKHWASQSGLLRYSQIAKVSDGIYGTSQGLNTNKGFLFKVRADLSGVDVIHSFDVDTLGIRPQAELMEGRDGYLYGTARAGGRYNGGVIFSINKDGSDYTVLHHFLPSAGKNPEGKLVQDSDGWIFGTTRFGGSGPFGIVFKIFEDGSGFQKLFNFSNNGGRLSPVIVVDDQHVYVTGDALYTYTKDGTLVESHDAFADVWRAPSAACDTYVTSIADGATGVFPSPTIVVKEMTYAAKYFLDVSTTADFTTYERHTSTSTSFPLVLEENTTYYTRVFSSLLPDHGPTISFTTGVEGDNRVAVRDEERDQNRSSGRVEAYPNPSRNGFNLNADPSEIKSIVVTEANGNIVYRFHNQNGQLPEQIGSDLSQGVYFLTVQTSTGMQTLRVVKQ